MSAHIIRGNALALPLADDTVDLVVTSPPYFGLRSYQDGGEHYAGQIGSEATPAEFVDALIAATREMVRVVKPSGSIWVNLGDKYSSGGRTSYDVTDINGARGGIRAADGHRPKTLLGIPWRYALRCIDDLGLILRAEVIWSKPNGLPESVTDRVRRSHEQWFHFTLQPRYFSAVDEIREEHAREWTPGRNGGHARESLGGTMAGLADSAPNPLGKLPGSVWVVPTQPLTVPPELGIDHFAAFPMEWPRRIIQGWSPAGVCTACGEGRRPVVQTQRTYTQRSYNGSRSGEGVGNVTNSVGRAHPWLPGRNEATITGYACGCAPHFPDGDESDKCSQGRHDLCTWGCGCDHHADMAPTRPAVVLDPFGGTGTTALVAKALGRTGISVDMSADYCRLAQWRTTDPGELARAMQVEKPAVQVEGQTSLLDMIEDAS